MISTGGRPRSHRPRLSSSYGSSLTASKADRICSGETVTRIDGSPRRADGIDRQRTAISRQAVALSGGQQLVRWKADAVECRRHARSTTSMRLGLLCPDLADQHLGYDRCAGPMRLIAARPGSLGASSFARRWAGFGRYSAKPRVTRRSAVRWTLCRVTPTSRAMSATVRGSESTVPSTSHHDAVIPAWPRELLAHRDELAVEPEHRFGKAAHHFWSGVTLSPIDSILSL